MHTDLLMSKFIELENLSQLSAEISKIPSNTILMVVDANVYNQYRKSFDFLNIEGKKVHLWKCLEGEGTKSYDELKHALEFFLSKNVTRDAHLVAFGGGACSDFGGLVASMLLRGVDWSVVPTTLLSMVDAAIGGKVAINSEYGKNLVGAFHLPRNIYLDTAFLETLPKSEMISGYGEVIKYCFLDEKIYDAVVNKSDLQTLIHMCAKYKQKIVEKDFKESGNRVILNLGHTVGHAIEHIYKIPHGYAVLWGLVALFIVTGHPKMLARLKVIVNSLGINMDESPWQNKHFPTMDIVNYIRKDKKGLSNEVIQIINVEEVGQPNVTTYHIDDVQKMIQDKEDELSKFIL
jgi:3-dehydroquinate synthase